jgi:hypothetical protein
MELETGSDALKQPAQDEQQRLDSIYCILKFERLLERVRDGSYRYGHIVFTASTSYQFGTGGTETMRYCSSRQSQKLADRPYAPRFQRERGYRIRIQQRQGARGKKSSRTPDRNDIHSATFTRCDHRAELRVGNTDLNMYSTAKSSCHQSRR